MSPWEAPPRKAPPPEGPAHRRLLARRPAPPAPMFPRTRLAALPSLLRALGPAPVAAMRTGTFVVSQPLNYRGGARVEPVDASGTEKAFEPATGNGTGTSGSARVPAKGRAGAWRAGVGGGGPAAWTASAKPRCGLDAWGSEQGRGRGRRPRGGHMRRGRAAGAGEPPAVARRAEPARKRAFVFRFASLCWVL